MEPTISTVDAAEWRTHPVHGVSVSSDGIVMGKRGSPLSVRLSDKGYEIVSLNGRWRRVHQLVMEAFVGPRPEGWHTCHWDGDKRNNHLSNLRYDTPSGNMEDSIRLGVIKRSEPKPPGPGRNYAFIEEDVIRIKQKLVDGYPLKKLARDLGVNKMSLKKIKRNQTWVRVPWPKPTNQQDMLDYTSIPGHTSPNND